MSRTLYLADTSALVLAQRDPLAAERLKQLLVARSLATSVTVDLEAGYAARTPAEYAATAADRELAFIDLPITAEVCARARTLQARLARTSQHRTAGVIDILTAAIAAHYGATVLHNDGDFAAVATLLDDLDAERLHGKVR